jgi:hypothetical protein
MSGLPRTEDRAYDLRQRFNRAVRWLREAEDIARTEMPAWPTADRIRDIYEQITDDLLNGKTTVPPLKQRLAEAEQALVAEVEKARADERAKVVSEVVAAIRERYCDTSAGLLCSDFRKAADFIEARFAPGTGDDER